MQLFRSPALRNRLNAGALIIVMLLWGLHLGYPMNLLQNDRWTFLGYIVPIYFFFTVGLTLAAAAISLTFKGQWSRWELLWWALPLICLPGIRHSADPLWSARQWLSWIIRGVIPGGIILLTAHRRKPNPMLLYWIYPVVIAASLLGLLEIYTNRNPLWTRYEHGFGRSIVETSQPTNPFYRPTDAFGSYLLPLGTQGNRIPYTATLVGFLPLGLWLLKYKKRFRAVPLIAVGILASILLLAQVRAAWVGTLTALLLMQAVGLLKNRRESMTVAAGALLCLGVFLAWPRTHDLLWSRFNSFHLSQSSIRERLAVLQTAVVLKNHGALGVGFGQFPMVCKPYYPAALVWQGTPDDQYLRWAIENGIPSLLLLAAFLIGLVRAGWDKIRSMQDVQEADYYKSILVGWLSVCATFLFFDGFYWGACNMTFWSLLGLFGVCLKPDQH